MIHVYFGFISCFKTSFSKRSLVLQPERMALLKSGIKRALSAALVFDATRHSMCRLGHTGANSLETRHDWLLTIIARPLFPSRHSATWLTLHRRPMGKRKTKTCSGSQPATGSRRRIAHCEAWQACEARSPLLAAKHSEIHQTKFLGSSQVSSGHQISGCWGQACTAG